MYLPQSLDPATRVPLVYVFHGATMSGQEMYDVTQYAAIADREGIALVFPDGEGGPGSLAPWNVENPGETVCGAGQFVTARGDDFGFMDSMKSTAEGYQCLDPAHVFVTGFSMGGYFTHHVGCYRDDVRAVAPHSGATIASLSSCTTGHRPVIIFHGTGDQLIAPGCDDPSSPAQSGFPPSATLWAQHNGCASTYTTLPESGDGGSGQCYLYDGCPADGQVELCTFTGMGHCWAGGASASSTYACPSYPSATQLEWDFFKHYAW
jgi:polyhydroxybutyrate depolymerase